jgi:CheY-like chemotaxis protein
MIKSQGKGNVMDSSFYFNLLYGVAKTIENIQRKHGMKSEFLASLSYELRTPLTSILGNSQLLSMEILLPTQQKYVSAILRAAEHILSLLDKMLNVSESKPHEIALKMERFNLKILLNSVMEMVCFHAYAKGLQFGLEYANDAPQMVISDRQLIRQIVLNLLSRAIKQTQQGSVLIQVTCVNLSKDFAELALRIQDTGTPMSQEALAKIKVNHPLSNPIDQATRHYGNVDFGLSIALDYLQLLQAKMTVENNKNNGTTLNCFIPFQLSHKMSSSLRTARPIKKSIPASTQHSNGKLRLLLVEDDAIIQAVHHNFLKKIQVLVDVANDAQSALLLYKKFKYDLILMDISLPDQDGIETTHKIRQLENTGQPRTPIIALTAHALPNDTQAFLKEGLDAVYVKPLTIKDFSSLIAKWTVQPIDY